MRKNFFALALAAAIALPAALFAADAQTPPPASAEPAPVQLSAEEKAQCLQAFGWYIGTQMPLNRLGLNDAEMDEFIKGFRAAVQGKENPIKDMRAATAKLDDFLEARAAQQQQEWDKKNKEYLTNVVDKMPGIQKTPSGLRYKIIEKGSAPVPTLKSTVTANYKGSFMDGRVFDSTEKQGGAPATFALTHPDGTPGVIEGWREGLQKIGKGGKIMLFVPHELAYGETGKPGIPPNSALIFEVELADVNDTLPAPKLTE